MGVYIQWKEKRNPGSGKIAGGNGIAFNKQTGQDKYLNPGLYYPCNKYNFVVQSEEKWLGEFILKR